MITPTEHRFDSYGAARAFCDRMIARGHDAWFAAGGLAVMVRERR